jgi:hypothetical protein
MAFLGLFLDFIPSLRSKALKLSVLLTVVAHLVECLS